jgi:carboxyl-terminal processing protease
METPQETIQQTDGVPESFPAASVRSLAPKPSRRNLSVKQWFLVLVFGFGMFGFGWQQGLHQSGGRNIPSAVPLNKAVLEDTATPSDVNVDFGLFWKVWNLVRDKHIDKANLKADKMLYGAINGMLSATGDPYTNFFDPEESKKFTETIAGSFQGIGAEMGMKDDALMIIAPLDDSPAQKAGLRAGDRVLKIDGEDIGALSLDEAVAKIRGQKGTTVTLTILRTEASESQDIAVKRDVIQIKSVKFEMKEDGIAWIRISQFGDTTSGEFATAAKQAATQKAKGIIVDVRSNPGGLLDSSVNIAGYFLPAKSPVVLEEDSSGNRKTLTTISGNAVFSQLPVVVLIDEGSASASEILAGALKDEAPDRVTLVGVKSFGKGSVQDLLPVTNNTSLKITIAHWLTPSGKQINKVGIAPDVEVRLTADDITAKRDTQLNKATDILKGKLVK